MNFSFRLLRWGRPWTWLAAAALSLCTALAPTGTQAQNNWPTPRRPVTFIVPSSVGTAADLLARTLGPKLSERWGVPVVVDNQTGAAGAIGMDKVAKAAPDGHTFLVAGSAFTTLAALRPNLPYSPLKSFAPVVLIGTNPLVLLVNNDVPAKTVPEFLAYVKKQPPGKLNYATPGVGSVHHMATELFRQEAGLSMLHVPYKTTAGALADLMGGQVQAVFTPLQTAGPAVDNGQLRLLAVASRERAARYPNTPTLVEAGLKNTVVDAWVGLEAPAGTPEAIVKRVNADINSLLKEPEVLAALEKMGVTAVGGTSAALGEYVAKELKTWQQVVAKAAITE